MTSIPASGAATITPRTNAAATAAGTTTAATAAPDAASTAALDGPDPTYPKLVASHVMVFRAIGTPEEAIAQFANAGWTPQYVEDYISTQILENPEAWDTYVENPVGTARAGLRELIPNFPAAPVGSQYSPNVDANVTVPTTPAELTAPTGPAADAEGGNGLLTGLLVGAGVVGAAIVGTKLFKGKQAKAAELLKQQNPMHLVGGQMAGMSAGGGAGVGANAVGMQLGHSPGRIMGDSFMHAGAQAGDQEIMRIGAVSSTIGHGPTAATGGIEAAASLDMAMRGFGPPDGKMQSLWNAAISSGERLDDIVSMYERVARADAAKIAAASGGDLAPKVQQLVDVLEGRIAATPR
ncbi:MAG: hypothetical protein JWM25_199 [Thermoleophilia bacterium]|nr:hypothetical protein [Thermoleophilia bacterium]